MKKVFILTVACMAILVSCKSEQQKAFERAAKSSDLPALRAFAAANPQMEQKVQEQYDLALESLIRDSSMFADVQNAVNVLEKCNAEEAYLAASGKGIHAKEVREDLAVNKKKAEELQELIALLRKDFGQYNFRVENYVNGKPEAGCDVYEFIGPDDSGKGSVNISPKHIEDNCGYANRYGIVDREIECSYYINDAKQIVLSQSESRTYSYRLTVLGGPSEWNRDLMRRIRNRYPTPEPMVAILSYSAQDGAPAMSGADESGKNWYFRSELK